MIRNVVLLFCLVMNQCDKIFGKIHLKCQPYGETTLSDENSEWKIKYARRNDINTNILWFDDFSLHWKIFPDKGHRDESCSNPTRVWRFHCRKGKWVNFLFCKRNLKFLWFFPPRNEIGRSVYLVFISVFAAWFNLINSRTFTTREKYLLDLATRHILAKAWVQLCQCRNEV